MDRTRLHKPSRGTPSPNCNDNTIAPYILRELHRRHHPSRTERLARLYENLPERPSEWATAIINDTYIQAFIIVLAREVSPLTQWSWPIITHLRRVNYTEG